MKALAEQINELDGIEIYGRVVGVRGLMVEVAGPLYAMSVGARVLVETPANTIPCEVVGFSGSNALLMPFAPLEGVRRGCRALVTSVAGAVRPSGGWLGRVVNALGEPIDGKGALLYGPSPYPFRNTPPLAHARRRVGAPLDLGVRALNTFMTCCRGPRMGIFSGSGVGKSVLLSMFARNVAADVTVIGLIGERGREVQEFLQDDLGAAGLARSVVVVSTSDEPALMRRQAAHVTLAIAEHFRDEGKDVLVLMDSVTRFAMAQREIGLAAGEPPTAKGYTPSVFTLLAQLIERAGHFKNGSITAFYTVLMEGDDQQDPLVDAVRALLDGHVVLDRRLSTQGHYPPISILDSLSRLMPAVCTAEHLDKARRARKLMAAYAASEDLIRVGAYQKGLDAVLDQAIEVMPAYTKFLQQRGDEKAPLEGTLAALKTLPG